MKRRKIMASTVEVVSDLTPREVEVKSVKVVHAPREVEVKSVKVVHAPREAEVKSMK